jgi:hypothetical protein
MWHGILKIEGFIYVPEIKTKLWVKSITFPVGHPKFPAELISIFVGGKTASPMVL